jgi:hypothetical protein
MNLSLVATTLQNEASVDYQYLGAFIGNLIDTMKMSLGDFGMIDRVQEDFSHKTTFWLTWGVIVLFMSIIFLNFIIAEASASYERVNELLHEVIERDKVGMINEAELMIPKHLKDNINYPKYLIKREISA